MDSKLKSLQNMLPELGRVAIALSGGTDSSFLLRVAAEAIPGQVSALTAVSLFLPEDDLEEARKIARQTGIAHHLIPFAPLEVPCFAENPPERCYHCKKALFRVFLDKAKELGSAALMDGTNADDLKDFRPGLKALTELSVRTPLAEVNFTKAEIRALSRRLGLSSWNKPSSPCLATRFPYGQPITAKAVERVKKAERYLKVLGYNPVRVRSHGQVACIEVEAGKIGLFAEQDRSRHISDHLYALGFTQVTLDRQGIHQRVLQIAD